MATYEEVYADWELLWSIAPADDMTGGYVDQEDLARLLKSPNKNTAKRCLIDQITYWFQKGPDPRSFNVGNKTLNELALRYPEIREIAEKYCLEDYIGATHD